MNNIMFNVYHKDIMDIMDKGYNVYILDDNFFTANIVVYKNRNVKKYILKKYFTLKDGIYLLKKEYKNIF